MSKILLRSLVVLAMLGLAYGCSDDDPTGPGTALTGTFAINDGDEMAPSVDVTLNFDVAEADSMRFRNGDGDWSDWAVIPVVRTVVNWTLPPGEGEKAVSAEFKATDGRTLALNDTIELDTIRTRILILDDGGTEVEVQTMLEAAGYTVTMGGLYYEYTGTDFSAYDLVILLYGYDYDYYIEIEVQQGLKDFVAAGGVLLTTEWLTYTGAGESEWETLIDLLPLAYNDAYCDDGDGACPETYTKLVEHPITEGLPATFLTPDDWTYSYQAVNDSSVAGNIQVLFEGSTSGSALGIGDFGQGHSIHWSMAGIYGGEDIWSTETSRVLTNIAAFAD
jgi:hypothetical protein